jgi:hypothetical protein
MSGPHHHFLKHLIHKAEYDHLFQFRFHIWMMVFWMVNVLAGTAVLILWPAEWVKIGVYYVFVLSVYANWDTDYDAVSESQAALHAQTVMRAGGGTDRLTKE